ncbi:MAG: ParB/RepB/Spo0J family partition protein [Hyphomonadaceae bacterium]|nr:ParB/RepB/Spo0J family partition protein [Hyphomonadaceae bacterium]
MNDRPRGLGRGLSALLGEPVRTSDFDRPAPAPAWRGPDPKVVELSSHQVPQPPQSGFQQPPIHAQPIPPQAPPVASAPPPQASAPVTPPNAAAEPSPRGIPIELVQRNPLQPRKHFDEAELNELASSIKAHGVLQPILVRPLASAPGRYEIVAGERRWRAAQKAGLHNIPAVIRELNEVEILEIGIIENVQRTDLNPIEEAQGYQALIDRFGHTQEDIADSVGKSRPHIANILRLLKLPDDIQEMVRDGRLAAGAARAILTSPDPMTLARKAIAENLNVREIERLAQQAKDEKHGPRSGGGAASSVAEKDADTRALERTLSDALGLPVTIFDKSGQGEVKIYYKTLEQLDEIARRLNAGRSPD